MSEYAPPPVLFFQLDQATWDLVAEYAGGGLAAWSGYVQEPGPLLEKAAELGLDNRDYRLVVQA